MIEENKDAFDFLLSFYKSYKEWLDAGAPEYSPYTRYTGLCNNIRYNSSSEDNSDDEFDIMHQARQLMKRQFKDKNLDRLFPFGELNYDLHQNGRMHLDPRRIKWVEDKIQEMEKVNESM